MSLHANNLNILQENIVNYSSDMFQEISLQKLGVIRLIAGVVVQSIADLYSPNAKLHVQAQEYFSSELYRTHCDMLALSQHTMDRIVRGATALSVRRYDDVAEVEIDEYGD